MPCKISLGFLSKAREMASKLSMLGRFVPRSMALICETLSFVWVAKSLSDQSRYTRSILIEWPRRSRKRSCGDLPSPKAATAF